VNQIPGSERPTCMAGIFSQWLVAVPISLLLVFQLGDNNAPPRLAIAGSAVIPRDRCQVHLNALF
jgi:hypothetical protein